MLIFETMPIWSKPEDEHYRGPCTYRLIVYGRNYCGKTFAFKQRIFSHKSAAKLWRETLEKGKHAQSVSKTIDNNWDDVVIEIIARYPDKIKGVEADELFMDEREIEAIKFYDSFNNGLNDTPGGQLHSDAQKEKNSKSRKGKCIGNKFASRKHSEEENKAKSKRMLGKRNALGAKHTQAMNEAKRKRMMGHKVSAATRAKLSKPITATNGEKTWKFKSIKLGAQSLSKELGKDFDTSSIAKAAKGRYGRKKNLSTYKGITFKYD